MTFKWYSFILVLLHRNSEISYINEKCFEISLHDKGLPRQVNFVTSTHARAVTSYKKHAEFKWSPYKDIGVLGNLDMIS